MSKQKSSNSGAFRAFVLTLVILILAVAVTAAMTQGFTNWNPYGWFDEFNAEKTDTPETETSIQNGGMIAEVQSSKELQLTKSAATTSSGAESSTTLTASVAPSDATNQLVDWDIFFTNPDSEWATGKVLSDYVTLTPNEDGGTIATVDCLQPFGEQITIKVTSRDNSEAMAYCVVDYLQKISNVALSFGDKAVILDGYTDFVWEINANGVGEGGATTVTYDESEVYTLAGNYTYSVKLENTVYENVLTLNGKTVFSSVSGTDITDSDFVLNHSFLTKYKCYVDGRSGTVLLYTLSPSELITYFQNIDANKNIFCVVVLTFNGDYENYEYRSNIRINGYTNTALVTGVSLDSSSIVF